MSCVVYTCGLLVLVLTKRQSEKKKVVCGLLEGWFRWFDEAPECHDSLSIRRGKKAKRATTVRREKQRAEVIRPTERE